MGAQAQPAANVDGASLRVADVAEAQRLALDADIRRAVAKARAPDLGSGLPAVPAMTGGMTGTGTAGSAPIPLTTPAMNRTSTATVVPTPAVERLALLGVARVRGQWWAEIDTGNGVRLVRSGDHVASLGVGGKGPWTVATVEAARVVLDGPPLPARGKKGPPRITTRTLTLAAPQGL